MGIAANKFRLLFLKAHQSDLEYKIMLLFNRRRALSDQAVQISSNTANNIFQSDEYADMYGGQVPGALPGFMNPFPGINVPQDEIPTGDYEQQLSVIHALDKELEMDAERIKILIESAKTESEAIDKLLRKNIEKEYKTFGGS